MQAVATKTLALLREQRAPADRGEEEEAGSSRQELAALRQEVAGVSKVLRTVVEVTSEANASG
jgi:hypothetical protein